MNYRNAESAFVAKTSEAMESGHAILVRGSLTRELRHQLVTLDRPLERTVTIPYRHNNPFAAIAETMWVIAGRNDVAFLEPYLSRAADFSDDGSTWRAGYGARLRHWHGVDQIAKVVELLNTDPHTRRAVMSIYDPATDPGGGKDVPCTNWLHFTRRDGVLDLAITVRSNDLFWGFSGINTFEWSVLLELVAFWTGSRVGEAHYFISSLHVYERHFPRARQIMAADIPTRQDTSARAAFATPMDDFDAQLRTWFQLENSLHTGNAGTQSDTALRDPLLLAFHDMLRAYWLIKAGRLDEARFTLNTVPDSDLAQAGLAYLDWVSGDEKLAPHPTESDRDPLSGLTPAVIRLHRVKDAMYGRSWKKRGEQISVLANIARKVDRLELADLNNPADGESLIDTGVDLYVYAQKYRTFLLDAQAAPAPTGATTWSDGPRGFEELIRTETWSGPAPKNALSELFDAFAEVEAGVDANVPVKARLEVATKLADASRAVLLLLVRKQPVEADRFLRAHNPGLRDLEG